jgi:ABC-type transport system involved in multi-copper enzyme maturation permease subunit
VRALGRLLAIATNTVREAVRNRLLYGLLFFAILLMFSGIFLSSLSYVENERILQDVGLGAIRLFGVAIAIFVGVGMVYREVDRRTVYTILSKPLTRSEFLLGKFAGLVLTIWLQMAIMVAVFALVSLLANAPLTSTHAAAVLLTGVELALVVAVAMFFSTFTTPMLATLFTGGVWVVGNMTRDLRDIGAAAQLDAVRAVTRWLYRLLPDLDAFDLSIEAVHGLPVVASDVWLPLFYGTGYAAVMLVLAAAIFERRDFR